MIFEVGLLVDFDLKYFGQHCIAVVIEVVDF